MGRDLDRVRVASHQGRYVFGPEFRLHMCVVQFADEGVGPRLAGVHTDVHVVLPMALPPLFVTAACEGKFNIAVYSKGKDLLAIMARASF